MVAQLNSTLMVAAVLALIVPAAFVSNPSLLVRSLQLIALCSTVYSKIDLLLGPRSISCCS